MPKVSTHDAAIYAANDLITALTKPQPPNSFLLLGDDQMVALQQLATIFQRAVTKKPTSDAPPPPPPPPNSHEHAVKQNIWQMQPSPYHNLTRSAMTNRNRPTTPNKRSTWTPQMTCPPPIPGYHIVPLIPNLRPKYPTKHAGMLEDLFPLIQSANAVTDPNTGKQLEYKQLINHLNCNLRKTWQHSSANEFGHLAQGVGGRIAGTETIRFIHHHEMPPTRRPTYTRFVCEIRPQKSEKERTRLTVGGSLIDYPDPVTTRTCNLVTFKMHINSTLSWTKRKYCSFDVKNFYLNTPMERSEYMKILLTHIPDEIIAEYALKRKVHSDGAIYIKIRKGMYGLPQAGMLANKLLKRRLAQHGYYEVRHTPSYWRHVWRPINFTLVVDDFGVGYEGNEHALHLLQTLCQYYEAVSIDWTGTLYCGITLKWDYLQRTCELSMPGYVQHAPQQISIRNHQHPQSNRCPASL